MRCNRCTAQIGFSWYINLIIFHTLIVIVLESLHAVDTDMAREWKLKPCPKTCCSCKKAIKNDIKIAPIDDCDIGDITIAPIDDCDIGDIVGKNTEGNSNTLTIEASKEIFQDQVKLFGLSQLKSVSSIDKLQYGKRKQGST